MEERSLAKNDERGGCFTAVLISTAFSGIALYGLWELVTWLLP